jgi:hypothetical protein
VSYSDLGNSIRIVARIITRIIAIAASMASSVSIAFAFAFAPAGEATSAPVQLAFSYDSPGQCRERLRQPRCR